ncbi:MAG TPA: hypothetical protein VGO19_00145 [Actinomycetes bacterium]|jgi:hypothetical protein
MPDLDRLREVGQLVRQPAFGELLDTRRRRTRRTRIATATALAVAVTVAVTVLATSGGDVRSDPLPVAPSPSPTPTEPFEIPAGQQTTTPEIRPGDVRGFAVLATVTNSQPGHQGDAELTATVTSPVDAAYFSVYCRGPSHLWYFWDRGDGGGGDGTCSPDADTTPRVLTGQVEGGGDIGELAHTQRGTESITVRMWITRPSAAYLRCRHRDTEDCTSKYGLPQPTVSPEAQFGFGIYSHESPRALRLFAGIADPTNYSYGAVSSIDKVAWLLDRAVAASPGADRLAFELPASDNEYLVDVYDAFGPHFERCVDQHAGELPDFETTDHNIFEAVRDQLCYADLQLVVDGAPVPPDEADTVAKGHFSELGARLPPGLVHRVEVRVIRGDPRNIVYAVIVRTRTELPAGTGP